MEIVPVPLTSMEIIAVVKMDAAGVTAERTTLLKAV